MWITNWLCILSIVEACGVAVHLELVDRIVPLLPQRIAQHYNYVRSGAFYPDAFYNCMGQYDVAEDAHWPPFLAKGVELVQERRKLNLDTSRLEAFLIGILSHQVSDVSWHSLGIFEGLLRAMAETEFDGDYDKAHSVLDIGGDMIELSRRAVRDAKTVKWEYDVDDIHALLSRNGYPDISSNSIRYCMARGQAAYTAELRVAGVGFKRYARLSPMLFDKLESYFAGGMTDMHEQIEECIPNLFNWFTEGPSGNPWRICPVFGGAQLDHSHPLVMDMDPPLVNTSRCGHQHRVHDTQIVQDIFNDNDYDDNDNENEDENNDDEHTETSYKKRSSYFTLETFGKAFEIFADIVAQGRDRVLPACEGSYIPCNYVQPPAPAKLAHGRIANMVQPSFGQSLAFWGTKLVVGAPSEGRVYIFDKGTGTYDIPQMLLASKDEPKGRGHFTTRFGTALAIWKDYLIVSSPGINQLDIYDSTGHWSGGIKWNSTTFAYGSRGFKLIGETMAVNKIMNSVIVGAPYVDIIDDTIHAENDDMQEPEEPVDFNSDMEEDDDTKDPKYDDGYNRDKDQVGMVFVLQNDILEDVVHSEVYTVVNPTEHILYAGQQHYEQAGSSIAVTPEFILVGSPGKSHVHGFDILTGKPLLTLTGEDFHPNKPSGFGGYLLAGNQNHLVVGAPAGSIPAVDGQVSTSQKGVISIFKHRRAQNIEGTEDFDWLGSSGVVSGQYLYVASPHSSQGKGMLWKINMDKPHAEPLGNVRNSFASGFGSSIATNDEVVAVGMPYFGLKTGQSRRGAVAIIPISK